MGQVGKGLLTREVTPNWPGLVDCIVRRGTPDRVYFIEQTIDREIYDAVCERYALLEGLDSTGPHFARQRMIEAQRFLGYDYVLCDVEGTSLPLKRATTEDTGLLRRSSGRAFAEEHRGPVTTWEEFEAYPWPDPTQLTTRSLEWYSENLPDDMCIAAGGALGHFLAWASFLMGYETLCYALYDRRDLVQAILDKLAELFDQALRRMLEFDRVKLVWGKDDMGFNSGTLISPDDLRELILPGHRHLAQLAHEAGRLYLLHSDGKIDPIMDDLIEDVGIDAKHAFEDSIEKVEDAKVRYGDRVSLLGGVDVDFLCRGSEEQIRGRVREILAACMPGAGFCLGTGNSVANYIPLDNYLIMLDEGRRYTA